MRVLTIDISGPFAHFRKIYGTNTAMSYAIPPRTTLVGLLAGVLGLPKESYHARTTPAHLRVGVALNGPVRKTYHRVNHLSVKGAGDFRGRGGHTQTPLELVSGPDLRRDNVHYTIYVAPGPEDDGLYDRLVATLTGGGAHYAPCLGAAFCPAFLTAARAYEADEVEEIAATAGPVTLRSAVNREWVERLDFSTPTRLRLDEDVFPHYFAHDGSRELGGSMQLIHGSGDAPLPVRLNRPAYRLPAAEQAFVFLEA